MDDRPPPMRSSDAEREAVADRLRHAAAEGRLDADELDERLSSVFAARTSSELEGLTADLPAPSPSPARRRPDGERDEDLRRRVAGFLTPNAICIAIWAATGAGSFWPLWVLLGTAILLIPFVVRHVLGLEHPEHEHPHRGRHRHLPRGD